MSNPKKTYYLGLSMAGTVSAGTYTAGSLIELDGWLAQWQAAVDKNEPVTLTALHDAGEYKKGKPVTLEPADFPEHEVKIASLTGASGGGVSGTLYMIGLATGKLEHYLRETWQSFNIDKMLGTDDLSGTDKSVYSVLNVLPIEEIVQEIKKIQWDNSSRLDKVNYIADTIELYQTLTSYEAIPYPIVPYGNTLKSPGIFNNHFDYIRFSLSKSHVKQAVDSSNPHRYDLRITNGQPLILDDNWMKLVESTPATGAFPIGFRPRAVRRKRDEYKGKLFYFKYSLPGSTVKYDEIFPNWTADDGKPIDMEYFDGGAFNREPHDLARASLIRYLNLHLPKPITQLPHKGDKAFASVILIDPFPSNGEAVVPGTQVKGIPTLFKQPGLLIGALMDQGRFHSDWVEKVLDEQYYSRFLISPTRPNAGSCKENYSLAGAPFSAFCGFIDDNYRIHDYKLGHYNTWKFLDDHFKVPIDNETVTYCQIRKNEKPADFAKRMDKYRALGWLKTGDDKKDYCQIIPRFTDQSTINSQLPEWPYIDAARWEDVKEMMLERAYQLFRNMADYPGILEWAAWKVVIKSKICDFIDSMEDTLVCAKLLKK